MKKVVKVSAPGKLMLFGEHAVIYNRPCIVTAVDQRITTKIRITNRKNICIDAPDVGLIRQVFNLDKTYKKAKIPKSAKFVITAVNNFFNEMQVSSGLNIATKSGFSSEFGFGSSSAVTVGVIEALSCLFNKRLSRKALFKLCYKTVLDVQGVGSGFDLAAAIWGGTIYFVTGGKKIEPISQKRLPLTVGYTGVKADTSSLVKQVAKLYKRNRNEIEKIFNLITDITNKAKVNIKRGNIKKLGELMNINQGLLEALGVGSFELSSLIYAAREAGVYGAKLSGAGGGDCMIALSSKKSRYNVEKLIKKRGGKVIDVKTGAEGVMVE